MIPEFLLAMGLTFNAGTGFIEDNDDPTAEAAPDWTVLVPESARPALVKALKTEELPDLDEWASVSRFFYADTIAVVIFDVADPEENVSTAFAATYTPTEGKFLDMTRLGSCGSETITPFIDVSDFHGESVAVIAREKPVAITISQSPEGKTILSTVEITEVDVWNAENSETETYRLTELHRTFSFGPDGKIILDSSRPVPTQRADFYKSYNVEPEM